MKKKFYNQYDSIVQTIRDNPGIKQGEIAQDNRHLASRGTILTRLQELEEASVVSRDSGYGKIVRYYLDDTTAFERLGKPVQKSRHDRLIEETEALMRQTRAVLDKVEPTKVVEPVQPLFNREDEDEEIRCEIHALFACNRDRKWLSFGEIHDECGQGSLDQTELVLDGMVDAGAVERAHNGTNGGLNCYRYSYRLADDTRWSTRENGQATFTDRVADMLRAADKPWQSADTIGNTFGTDAETINRAMKDADAERFIGRLVFREGKPATWCYALTERAQEAVRTPVEPVESVEAPSEPVVPVEAPTPPQTLQDIIEQAMKAAVELTSRNHADQMAVLMAERDAAREQLAAVRKLVAG